ncbi:Tyrosine recombinase XerC [anaerobic digester metagenome]
MRGYIRQYGKSDKWSYTVDVGKIDGKRKKIERGGFSTKAEAEAALTAKLHELNTTGAIFEPSKMTFDELYKEFLDMECRLTKRANTIKKYDSMYIHHVKDNLGHRYVKSITARDIDKFIVELSKKGYSEGFIKSNFNFIAAVFSYAVRQKHIKESPSLGASIPKVTKAPIEILTTEQIETMLDLLSNSNLITGFIIGLYTGMRVGEVFGLRWSDINFKTKSITINKQLLFETDHWCLGLPKTNGSSRVVKMSEYLATYLQQCKENQAANRAAAGEWYFDNKIFNNFTKKVETVTDFVNVKEDGTFLTSDSAKYIPRVAKTKGIHFHFHLLRHTHATQLLENGASIKLVQERLGHARPEITLQTYSHVTPLHENNVLESLPCIRQPSDI